MNQWTRCLINGETLRKLYDGTPPLNDFELRELRVDQRGPSCFFSGLMARFPDRPQPNWPEEADRLQIRFNLTSVEEFQASGESAGGLVDLTIHRADDGFGVVIRAEGRDFHFEVQGIGLQILGIKPFANT